MHRIRSRSTAPALTPGGVTRPGPRGSTRVALATVLLTTLVTAACASSPAEQPSSGAIPEEATRETHRPNIVFIFADDHAAHALSAYAPHLRYGEHIAETPRLDALAAEGMLFTNAFVTNSICAPSRATVLTGQYGHLNGVMTNGQALHPTDLAFPGLLREAGYRTALFGKWHLQEEPEGFDHYEVLTGQGPYYNPTLHSARDTVSYTGYTPEIITDRAVDWLASRDDDTPFLLMLHHNAAHRYWDPGPAELGMYGDTLLPEPGTFHDDASGRASPAADPEMSVALDLFPRDLKLEAPRGLTAEQRAAWDRAYAAENAWYLSVADTLPAEEIVAWKYQRYIKDYLRTVAALDRSVGRVVEALERAGITEETLIVYTSDQGFFLGDHGWFDKRWMYEESLRIPLIVRWPGTVTAGSVNRDLVMNLDLAETLLDAGGAPVPAAMQGRSLVPLLNGRAPADWRDAIYYQYFEYPGWHMVRRQHGVRTDRYKLIHYYEVGEWELFDLERDPEELDSVHDDPRYAAIRADLEARLTRLRAQYAVPAEDPVPYEEFAPQPRSLRTGASPAYDWLIAGGTVVDGSGAPARVADVLLRDGRIAHIGAVDPDTLRVRDRYDATGRIVAPGFIDAHAHGAPERDPRFDNALAMGVTTIVLGQDGGGPEAGGLAAYLDAVDAARPWVNIAYLVGHNTVRMESGVEHGAADAAGIRRMAALVEAGLDAGAFGLSTGLEYDPGIQAAMPELTAVARPVGARGGVVMSHVRSEDPDRVDDSLAELIEQGRTAGARVHASHMKVVLSDDPADAERLLAAMAAARADGVAVTGDVYPYIASYTGLSILFPEWARPPHDYAAVVAERRAQLADYLRRRVESRNGPGAMLFGTGRWKGRTLADVAAELGRPFEDVLVELGPDGASAAYTVMDETVMRRFLADPHVVVSTDGSPTMLHPRSYGAFARVIRRYVVEEEMLGIEEAVRKMSGSTAAIVGLDDAARVDVPRGKLREGWAADVVVFDPTAVRDRATYDEPYATAEGFTVWVAGEPVWQDGGVVGEIGRGVALRARY